MTTTTKELLALVDTLRARATEHGDLHRKQTGYEVSFEDAGKESAYDNAADELASIAAALCAEVEALTDALARLCSNKPRTSPQIDADWDNARAVLAKFAKEPK